MHSHMAFLVPPRAAGQGSPAKVKASGPFLSKQEKEEERKGKRKGVVIEAAPPASAPAVPGCACPSKPPVSLVTPRTAAGGSLGTGVAASRGAPGARWEPQLRVRA